MYVDNKIDAVSLEEVDRLARESNTVVMSCEMNLGLDDVVEELWYQLNLSLVFTKKKGIRPDFSDPLVVRNNSTIGDLCHSIHRDFKGKFNRRFCGGPLLSIRHKNVVPIIR